MWVQKPSLSSLRRLALAGVVALLEHFSALSKAYLRWDDDYQRIRRDRVQSCSV